MIFDVAVVGAGLVGASLVRALAGSGLSCVLVDAAPPRAESGAWDNRVYALSPASQRFLDRLGIWSALDTARVAPVRRMKIFGDGARSSLQFSAYESGVERLASIVESGQLQRALWQSLQHLPGVAIRRPDRPSSLSVHADAVELRLHASGIVRARLVVGADGLNSWVRTAAGMASRLASLEQTAVVANFACAVPHRGAAFQWFAKEGVLAWLPLPGDRLSMVWSTGEAHARRLVGMTAAELSGEVAEAGAGALGQLNLITAAVAFPLVRLSVASSVAPRVALIGDAAHVIHPLAGQVVNLGFGDAEALAGVMTANPDTDPGERLLLRRFERSRAEAILAMQCATDGLHRLFESRWPGVSRLRAFGLNLTDRLPVMKNLLARQAMT
jgi:ubiquinone biosynthesis UbiH/UbiF/VisC/COQ6 family hydroxylase